jgi:hypothetical protein
LGDWSKRAGRQPVTVRKANGEGQEGGELKDDRADIAALRCMIYREDRPALELELSCSRALCGKCC